MSGADFQHFIEELQLQRNPQQTRGAWNYVCPVHTGAAGDPEARGGNAHLLAPLRHDHQTRGRAPLQILPRGSQPSQITREFAFDVTHECSWGSRGSFIPARYNSSRAKCIKCTYCNMYFSPNKFIFHSHRTPESKYTQPDAANFNSWRRHLKLTDKSLSDDLSHAWEDVKAMFNGGSRKRAMPGSGSEMSSLLKPRASGITQTASPDIPHKTLRCDDNRGNLNLTSSVRNYPVIPVPSKSFGMLQKIPPPIFPHPYSFPAFGLCQRRMMELVSRIRPMYLVCFGPVRRTVSIHRSPCSGLPRAACRSHPINQHYRNHTRSSWVAGKPKQTCQKVSGEETHLETVCSTASAALVRSPSGTTRTNLGTRPGQVRVNPAPPESWAIFLRSDLSLKTQRA